MSNKISSLAESITRRKWFRIISKQGKYFTVEMDGESVVLHPRVPTTQVFRRVGVPKNHHYIVSNKHAIKCECSHCRRLKQELYNVLDDGEWVYFGTNEGDK